MTRRRRRVPSIHIVIERRSVVEQFTFRIFSTIYKLNNLQYTQRISINSINIVTRDRDGKTMHFYSYKNHKPFDLNR